MKAYPILRVSTKKQTHGQGLESQYLYLQHWLSQHPQLELGEPLELDGLSAYSQKHLPVLKKFISSLPVNSTIVFSEVSRLARMDSKASLELLFWILNQGVSVGFAAINTILKASEEIDALAMQQLVMMFDMARSESAIKSLRINNTFKLHLEQLRAGTRIKTSGLPKWITVKADKYTINPYDMETIKRVYALRCDGLGCYEIVKALSARKTFPNLKQWSYSYVNDLLKSRLVLGEYQPVQIYNDNGKSKRKSKGEPIINFYPQVVDNELFDKVQKSFRHSSKGAKSTFNNLYRGVVRCGCCGGAMSINKTASNVYYRCEQKKNTHNCNNKSIRYSVVDERITEFLGSFDLSSVLTARRSHNAIQAELATVNSRIAQIASAIAAVGNDVPELIVELQKLTSSRDELTLALIPTDEVDLQELDKNHPRYNSCIRDLFGSITITPDTTRFTFNDLLRQGIPSVSVLHNETNSSTPDTMKLVNDNFILD